MNKNIGEALEAVGTFLHDLVRESRYQRGLCVECGKYPPVPDNVRCGLCLCKLLGQGRIVEADETR